MTATKTCTGCGHDKPPTEFYRQTKAPDGLRARCKTCLKSDAAERYERLTAEKYAAKLEQKRLAEQRARREAGVQPRRVGRTPRCTYTRCKRAGVEEGLCSDHHDELTNDRESPLDIGGGRWVRVGLTERWVAA